MSTLGYYRFHKIRLLLNFIFFFIVDGDIICSLFELVWAIYKAGQLVFSKALVDLYDVKNKGIS